MGREGQAGDACELFRSEDHRRRELEVTVASPLEARDPDRPVAGRPADGAVSRGDHGVRLATQKLVVVAPVKEDVQAADLVEHARIRVGGMQLPEHVFRGP
jgi:hypothetical protein